MGQILHAGATTTERIRKEIQESAQSLSHLARLYRLDRKTVRKWKMRARLPRKWPICLAGGLRRKRCALTLEQEKIILASAKRAA